jgi:hypothetical protein
MRRPVPEPRKPLNIILTLLFSLMALGGIAQSRIIPGVLYYPGDTLYAPANGIVAFVPENWNGLLPQDTEVFLLSSMKYDGSRMFVRASENTLETMAGNWESGLELAGGLKLQVKDSISRRNNVIFAKLAVEGGTQSQETGYAVGKCGDYGRCFGFILITRDEWIEQLRPEVTEFVKSARFIEPKDENIYEDFDWKDFLKGKYLVSFTPYQNYRRQAHVWLYKDGTFKSDIKRAGFVKADKNMYWGKNKGTWSINGKGESAELILNFKKNIPILTIPVRIDEDKIFLFDQRFFVMDLERVKKL